MRIKFPIEPTEENIKLFHFDFLFIGSMMAILFNKSREMVPHILRKYKLQHIRTKEENRISRKLGLMIITGYETVFENPIYKELRRKSIFEHFGVDEPFASKEIQKARKETFLKKYGFIYPIQNQEIKDKMVAALKKSRPPRKPKLPKLPKPSKFDTLKNKEFWDDKEFWIANFVYKDRLNRYLDKHKAADFFGCHPKDGIFNKQINILALPYKPKVKHGKTENVFFEIFDKVCYEKSKTHSVSNDRSILNGKELDGVNFALKLAFEYNGILYHSFGLNYPHNLSTEECYKDRHIIKIEKCEEKGFRLINVFSFSMNAKEFEDLLRKIVFEQEIFTEDEFVLDRNIAPIQIPNYKKTIIAPEIKWFDVKTNSLIEAFQPEKDMLNDNFRKFYGCGKVRFKRIK
jgi:hypothetical protein